MARHKFLDQHKFRFFCQGLTLDSNDLDVQDAALIALNEIKKIPSKIVKYNQKNGFGDLPVFKGPQIIVSLDKLYSPEKGKMSVAPVSEHKDIIDKTPALHVKLRSPSLDIPQRVEIPLRYVLKIIGAHKIITFSVKQQSP